MGLEACIRGADYTKLRLDVSPGVTAKGSGYHKCPVYPGRVMEPSARWARGGRDKVVMAQAVDSPGMTGITCWAWIFLGPEVRAAEALQGCKQVGFQEVEVGQGLGFDKGGWEGMTLGEMNRRAWSNWRARLRAHKAKEEEKLAAIT